MSRLKTKCYLLMANELCHHLNIRCSGMCMQIHAIFTPVTIPLEPKIAGLPLCAPVWPSITTTTFTVNPISLSWSATNISWASPTCWHIPGSPLIISSQKPSPSSSTNRSPTRSVIASVAVDQIACCSPPIIPQRSYSSSGAHTSRMQPLAVLSLQTPPFLPIPTDLSIMILAYCSSSSCGHWPCVPFSVNSCWFIVHIHSCHHLGKDHTVQTRFFISFVDLLTPLLSSSSSPSSSSRKQWHVD